MTGAKVDHGPSAEPYRGLRITAWVLVACIVAAVTVGETLRGRREASDRAERTLRLRAVDSRDPSRPIPQATFWARTGVGSARGLGETDAGGRLTVAMEPGARLDVQPTAFGSPLRFDDGGFRSVGADSPEAIFAVDSRPQRILVRVENRSANAELSWYAEGPTSTGGSDPRSRGLRDDEPIEIKGLVPEHAYDVLVWETVGGALGRSAGLRVALPSEETRSVHLHEPAAVRGRLLRAASLAGAKVEASPIGRGDPGQATVVPVGEDGRFILHLPEGRWRLGALALGKERWLRVEREVLVADQALEVELAFE
jgi:hypothetical protein